MIEIFSNTQVGLTIRRFFLFRNKWCINESFVLILLNTPICSTPRLSSQSGLLPSLLRSAQPLTQPLGSRCPVEIGFTLAETYFTVLPSCSLPWVPTLQSESHSWPNLQCSGLCPPLQLPSPLWEPHRAPTMWCDLWVFRVLCCLFPKASHLASLVQPSVSTP